MPDAPPSSESPELTSSASLRQAALTRLGSWDGAAQGLWTAIDPCYAEYREDRAALSAILQAVPREMLRGLAKHDTAKAAWDAIKTMRVGVDRVSEAREQGFRRQFEAMRFKDGETPEEFAMRLTAIVADMRNMGGVMEDEHINKKLLRVVPKKYKPVAISLEQLLDVKTMALEELIEWLSTVDSYSDDEEASDGGKLYLTKEQWQAGVKQRDGHGCRDISKVKCFNCDEYGHYSKQCRMPRRQCRGEANANLVQAEEEPTLLMAHVMGVSLAGEAAVGRTPCVQEVHLTEKKVVLDHEDGRKEEKTGEWFLDTGATNHLTGARSAFAELDTGVVGTSKNGDHRSLEAVYYIPKLRKNIVSVGRLDARGYDAHIWHGVFTLRDPEGMQLAKLNLATLICMAASGSELAWRWHARFGHLNFLALRRLAKGGVVRRIPQIDHIDQLCDGYLAGKQHRTPFPEEAQYRAQTALELVHGDLCGPITPATTGGKKYFLLLVDDMSHHMWIRLLSAKHEASAAIKPAWRRIAIGSSWRCALIAGQNSVVERRNQTVVAAARSMLKAANMLAYFWGEAVVAAVYVLSKSPMKSLDGVTPYEAWYGRRPTVEHLRVFECVGYVKTAKPNLRKLDDRSTRMVFIGYEQGSKAYKMYDFVTTFWDWGSNTDEEGDQDAYVEFTVENFTIPVQGSETHAQDAAATPTMLATSPTSSTGTATTLPSGVEFCSPPTDASEGTDEGPRSYRTVVNTLATLTPILDFNYSDQCLMAAEEPASFLEAEQESCWRKAMLEEMESIEGNNTWTLYDLPSSHRATGLKWVYKIKRDAKDVIVKYKARLVAKGYVHQQGVDFDEVFAPVTRMETVRLLIATAAHQGWEVHQMDVKLAFLNRELEEDA
uniref:Retrotransposon protein, putative, Ty1-copia subclass n=1 Tax=Oryza sativa subsp. japonica TaxID=39947 RepID=Q338T4_ORYSJ|nr:retrotransposon protein, putative, Ty1-copia subclass [Oryza sativa Japonica Group]